MYKIKIEVIGLQRKEPIECSVARVPVVGDEIEIEDGSASARVETVFLLLNPRPRGVVAIVRVRW